MDAPFSPNYNIWLDAIKDHDEFYCADKGEYLVFNYKSIMAQFLNPLQQGISRQESLYRNIRRNCRGAIFDAKTKQLIRLPLHKFLNYLQNPGESYGDYDWNNFEVYSKADGSMCAPFMLNGEIRWGSKMGLTHIAPDMEAFVAKNSQYDLFASSLINQGFTPTFEYMSPKHKIVVDVPKETMVLLAVRNMYNGDYLLYNDIKIAAERLNVPVIRRWEVTDGKSLLESVENLTGEEGVVVRFPNDERIKIKGTWYRNLHKTRDSVTKERFVAMMALTDCIDDMLPLVPDHVKINLLAYTKVILDEYIKVLAQYTTELSVAIGHAKVLTKVDLDMFDTNSDAFKAQDRAARKEFAMNPNVSDIARRIGFKIFDEYIPGTTDLMILIDRELRNIIVQTCESTETKFNEDVRKKIFNNKLLPWNIWLETEEDE